MMYPRFIPLAWAVLFVVGLGVCPLRAQVKLSGPRTQTAVELEMSDTDVALSKVSETPGGFLNKDKDKHADMLAVAVPLLKKRVALAEEWSRVTKDFGSTRTNLIYYLAVLHALGDDETVKLLEKMGRGADANYAKLPLTLSAWYANATDAASQTKTLDNLHALAKAYPSEDTIAHTAILMQSSPAAKAELTVAVEDTLYKDLRGPEAMRWKVLPHVGRPLVLAGTLLNGQNFSTAKLKGKVLLVHFWAAGDQPSRTELAVLRQLFAESKDQGLEVIGVLSESPQVEATHYLTENNYSFAQFYDAKTGATQHHPFMPLYDVREYNTIIVLDRAGNFRAMVTPPALVELIPKLLAEKPPEKATTEPAAK